VNLAEVTADLQRACKMTGAAFIELEKTIRRAEENVKARAVHEWLVRQQLAEKGRS
jgi:hypothetical protein